MERMTVVNLLSKLMMGTCLALIISCGNYEELKSEPSSSFDNIRAVSGLTFADIQKQVIGPKCITCHAGYTNYSAVKADLSKILREVLSDNMPKKPNAPLTDDEKSLLVSWQEDGAPLGNVVAIEPSPEDDGLQPNWKSISKNILQKKCTACHNPQGEQAFLPFTTRLEMFSKRDKLFNFDEPEKSYILEVIQDSFEPMPPLDSPFKSVTQDEINVLTEWIRLGLP